MKIAIELNNIVRDFNAQVLKYYIKDIDPLFDDENIDLNSTDILSVLPFKTKKDRKTFREIDYPYELFGCARTTSKHLHVDIEKWLEEHKDDEVIYFSLNERDLTIQSTFFFLSKGSRVRNVLFPKNAKDIWNYCDVAVTLNKDVVKTKPTDKKCVLIKKTDNQKLEPYADVAYESLNDLLNDENFGTKLEYQTKRKNFLNKILPIRWLTK